MIRALVDFALKSRWLVLGGVVVLTAWGIVSFRKLPIEAYPDVANNYVQIITQWPGRSAEEIERQVTVPVEIQMAGIPHLTHLRSTTLAGLSSLMLIFDDDSTSDVNREHVLERLSQVNLPANLVPQMGTDWSPVGQIYWYTLESTNPSYDVMEKKALEDWTLEKELQGRHGRGGCVELRRADQGVPGPAGPGEAGLLRVEHRAGGTANRRQQHQRRRQLHRAGSAADQCAIGGPLHQRAGHREHRHQDAERRGHPASGTSPRSRRGRRFAWGRSARARHRPDGVIVDNPDTVEGIVLLQKGDDSDPVLEGIHDEVEKLNHGILPKGVKVVPFLDRSDLVKYTVETVEHNLTEGVILVSIILFLFLGNVRGAIIVALTIPFALLFASICLDLSHIPANLLSLGALDFGMVVDGAVVMIENIVRHLSHKDDTRTPAQKIREAAHEVQRPVFFAAASSSPRTCRSLHCRPWREGSSSRWPGRWPLRCWAR